MKRLIVQRGRRCQTRGCGRTHDVETGKPIRIFGDHIVELRDGGAPLDPRNVMLVCGSCHTTKTIRVRAARMAETFAPVSDASVDVDDARRLRERCAQERPGTGQGVVALPTHPAAQDGRDDASARPGRGTDAADRLAALVRGTAGDG